MKRHPLLPASVVHRLLTLFFPLRRHRRARAAVAALCAVTLLVIAGAVRAQPDPRRLPGPEGTLPPAKPGPETPPATQSAPPVAATTTTVTPPPAPPARGMPADGKGAPTDGKTAPAKPAAGDAKPGKDAKAGSKPAPGAAKPPQTPADTPPKAVAHPGNAFDLDTVAEKARHLARAPYGDPQGKIPDWLLKISYDQWRDIRFRPDKALWAGTPSPFQVQFFHPGLFYDRPVSMNVVAPDGVKPVPFSPSLFDYGRTDFASRVPQDLGFAGFRLHFPIKTPTYFDEVIVFLGATYFRALGRDQVFGLSARGIAIDTAEPWGEEFPWFREFWLVAPGEQATSATIYALLDSPRLTGAYRFVVTPGEQTRVDVECRLFLRDEIRKLGIAPVTSMFFHGENSTKLFFDFRPEVHDSDGILLQMASGEWIWRPVDNVRGLHVSGPRADALAGFGLLQRDRDFAHYQDLETAAERRPSLWIVPWGNWGAGRLEIVEIPTNNDTNDNVVAYWVPDQPPKPGESATYGYTQFWYGDDPTRPPGGRVIATRRDAGTLENGHRFVIDFAGGRLAEVPPSEVLRAVVTVAGGEEAAELRDQYVLPNPHIQGWRLSFQIGPKRREAIELRAFLELGGEVLTETWSYAILP